MRRLVNSFGLAAAVLTAVALGGCSTIKRSHGYVPTDSELEEVVVGVDTRDTVSDVIGPPTTAGVMRDNAWYYVASSWETRLYFAPEEISRELVAISFDPDGVVANVERFGLQDGNVVALNRRVTDDNIKGVTFLGQLLGNVGNFDASQVLGNN